MVVLTDGLDTSSYEYRFDEQLIETTTTNDITVFTTKAAVANTT